jgi:hypothetical protein
MFVSVRARFALQRFGSGLSRSNPSALAANAKATASATSTLLVSVQKHSSLVGGSEHQRRSSANSIRSFDRKVPSGAGPGNCINLLSAHSVQTFDFSTVRSFEDPLPVQLLKPGAMLWKQSI